jgi:hypothetical protein
LGVLCAARVSSIVLRIEVVAVVAFPIKLGAVTDVVATIAPFGYIREYPQPHSHAHSHPAQIHPVAPISPVTWSLFDGVVVPIPTLPQDGLI